MLREFVETGRYSFREKFESWEEAIAASCEPIIKEGVIEPVYVEAVINCVKKYGPYIIIAPNIAMPHSTEGADGVNETAICFMKVEEPVHFDPEDPEKDARLFFVLASADHEKHLENMMRLSEMLMNEELVEELLEAKSKEDLLAIDKKYLEN